ncbi:MAG: hypothetical protein IT533_00305 [Hyphomicrobiales bacterium]|jgi:hypothetical protein|nr:hypothetical protein [Hyphomicrobiales bacterium]MCO5084723.1 hypothetical protein [Rhizobiaceae bacterium]
MPDQENIKHQGTHKADKDDLIRQQQAEHGGTGGQDRQGQQGGNQLRDKQQRGGQADNTRQ